LLFFATLKAKLITAILRITLILRSEVFLLLHPVYITSVFVDVTCDMYIATVG